MDEVTDLTKLSESKGGKKKGKKTKKGGETKSAIGANPNEPLKNENPITLLCT